MAQVNPAAAKQLANIKGEQYIYCRPGKIFGHNAVSGEGISIFTTSNNYGCVLYLLGMLCENSISTYYQIILKTIKRDMNQVLYDKLIHLHQDKVNKQRYIEISNVNPNLFDTQVNFLKHHQSIPITVTKFLQGQGKVLAIEPTIDTEESGTYRLITNNKDHDITIKKLRELQTYLMKEKETNPTMTTSFERFGTYIEVNGRQPINDSTSDLVERLELQIKNSMDPTQQNTQNIPVTPTVTRSLWDLPMNISMPTAPSPSTTLTTFKSVVQS